MTNTEIAHVGSSGSRLLYIPVGDQSAVDVQYISFIDILSYDIGKVSYEASV